MKGIILAGGRGTRLFPSTRVSCKQLLSVYDKPMIYYPLSTLMLAGIREILLISTPEATPRFQELLSSGEHLGLKFSYKVQDQPYGLAQALVLGEEFIGQDSVCLILGDNIFYGDRLGELLTKAAQLRQGAQVFGYLVKTPADYGVIEVDAQGQAISLEEKPENPLSPWVVTGLYFYDNQAVSLAKTLKPSPRGEYEITDLNKLYLAKDQLRVELLGRGIAWMDVGTHDSLLDASNFIRAIEERQGLKIACIEEIAFKKDFIDKAQLQSLAEPLRQSGYGEYLVQIVNTDPQEGINK